MNIKQLLKEDDGVSPVIGVILMVAITVILAAVIAAFVLGIGDTDDVAPQSSFSVDTDGGEFTIELTSGDSIDAADLELRAMDGAGWDSGDDSGPIYDFTDDLGDTDEWGVGESVTFDDSPTAVAATGGEVTGNLVWVGDGEDVIYSIDVDVPDST